MKKQKGFIAFTSLLIVSVAVLAIALSIPILGVTEANTSLGFAKGQEAFVVAESCGEEALLKIRDSENYTGETLTVGNGTCTIAATKSGNTRTINISATITGPPDYVKNIQVVAKRIGVSVNISSWEEIE